MKYIDERWSELQGKKEENEEKGEKEGKEEEGPTYSFLLTDISLVIKSRAIFIESL